MSAPASSSTARPPSQAAKRRSPEVPAGQSRPVSEPPARRRKRSRFQVLAEGAEMLAGAEAVPAVGQGGLAPQTRTSQQENRSASPIEPNRDKKSDAPKILARLVDNYRCLITQQLLVDPVIAEDGHVYERRALEDWLMRKQTSPTTNKAMGQSLVPDHVVRQTVSELVESGILDTETTLNFFTDRSRIRAMRSGVPGPDTSGALSDIQRAMVLARSRSHRTACEFHKEVITKMQEWTYIVRRAQILQSEVGAAFGQAFHTWVLQLGDAVRAAVTAPIMKECHLREWKQLPKGTMVKVVDDANELHKLCERTPPGAEAKVGWNAEMLGFAGQVCIVQRVGDAAHTNYILRRQAPPCGRDFSFPYNALFLLSS